MKYYYDYESITENKEIWACAYCTNNTEKSMYLKKKPVKGKILYTGENDSWTNKKIYEFREFKKDGTLKNTKVNADSRMYADTYEECVELYNSLIDEEIKRAEEVIEEHKKQKIIVEGE